MDIDAALERMRQLCRDNPESEFAIAFEAMDGWLSRGGFFPAAWRKTSLAEIQTISKALFPDV